MVAWQHQEGTTKEISEFQVEIEPTTSTMPVRYSNHWASRTPGDLGRFTGFLFTQCPTSNAPATMCFPSTWHMVLYIQPAWQRSWVHILHGTLKSFQHFPHLLPSNHHLHDTGLSQSYCRGILNKREAEKSQVWEAEADWKKLGRSSSSYKAASLPKQQRRKARRSPMFGRQPPEPKSSGKGVNQKRAHKCFRWLTWKHDMIFVILIIVFVSKFISLYWPAFMEVLVLSSGLEPVDIA